jgi:hypothetical protein
LVVVGEARTLGAECLVAVVAGEVDLFVPSAEIVFVKAGVGFFEAGEDSVNLIVHEVEERVAESGALSGCAAACCASVESCRVGLRSSHFILHRSNE